MINRFINGIPAPARLRKLAIAAIVTVAITTCAFAADRTEVPLWATVLISVTSGGGIVGLLMLRPKRRETDANAGKLAAEAEESQARTTRNLFDEIDDLYENLKRERERADKFESEVRQLRELVAVVIAANRVRDPRAFTALFDLVSFGVALTSAQHVGRFEWVNRGMCRVLGRSKEEIIRIGWQGLVDPDDLTRTQHAEAAAHLGPLLDFRNCYIHADGTKVPLSWHAVEYEDGITVAFAFPLDAEGQEEAHTAPHVPVRKKPRHGHPAPTNQETDR